MIRISKKRLKVSFSHTGSNGGAYTIINHNFGTRDVNVTVRFNSTSQDWSVMSDYFAQSGNFGVELTFNTTAQVQLRMFQFQSGNPTATLLCEAIIEEA